MHILTRMDEIFEFRKSKSIKFGRSWPNLPNEDSVVLTSTFNFVTADKLSVFAIACSFASLNDSSTWFMSPDFGAIFGEFGVC